MIRKILYVTGTRADYGLMKLVLQTIEKETKLKLEIAVTGMHLMEEFGLTVNEIKKGGFKIHMIDAIYEKDNKGSMTNFIGKLIQLLTKEIKKIKPDIILILGDRGEMLAGAIVGSYLNIPVAHIHGGDVSSTVDEHARHAITKLAHIHLPATKRSAKRLIKMGEEKFRVHVVGSPAIDSVLKAKSIKHKEVTKKFNLDLSKPIMLMIQHPVTLESNDAAKQIRETLNAVVELKYQTILIYPNADAGGRRMIKVIKEYERYPFIKTFKSLYRVDYLNLMKIAGVMVGNSSSGIVEAPAIHCPVVNIGTRQHGRERSSNIIDIGYNKDEIIKAIKKALYDKKFKETIKKCKNLYGDGKASVRVVDVLSTIKIDRKLLQKKLTY